MNINDIRENMAESGQTDQWWLAINEEVQDTVYTLNEIYAIMRLNPRREYAIIHFDDAQDDDAEWVSLDAAPRVAAQLASAKAAAEAAAESSKTADAREPLVSDDFLYDEVAQMRNQLDALTEAFETLSNVLHTYFNFDEKMAELTEREKYLEKTEEALLEKTYLLEEARAELENAQEAAGNQAKLIRHVF